MYPPDPKSPSSGSQEPGLELKKLVGGPGFEPGASRSRTGRMSCPLMSRGILQGPAEFNRRSRRLLSCPLRSAWFRDSGPRLCPGGAYFPTIQPVTKVQRLTWEQYLTGEPCRGYGRPMRDATLWSGSGKELIHLSEKERAQYALDEYQIGEITTSGSVTKTWLYTVRHISIRLDAERGEARLILDLARRAQRCRRGSPL